MSGLQIVGTLLAVPLGLASGYSMYRANFSAETSCQNLRGNIVAMLDKSVDVSARHMLVRRDVEAFEKTCGDVDPDATAAFKVLLTAEKNPPAPVAVAVTPRPEPVVRRVESRPEPAAKQAAPKTALVPAEVKPVQRDADDAQWLAAVRQALVAHTPAPASIAHPAPEKVVRVPPAEPVPERVVRLSPPAIQPMPPEVRLPEPRSLEARRHDASLQVQEHVQPPLVLTPEAAPALPPPVAVERMPPSSAEAAPDHPVPPGAIPEAPLVREANAAPERKRSRLGRFVAHIPLVGRALDAIDPDGAEPRR
jgi:hypothetical protein